MNNYSLYEESIKDDSLSANKVIKEGLLLNSDYRGVNKDVWKLLMGIYGGGPIIAREQCDIYSKDTKQLY